MVKLRCRMLIIYKHRKKLTEAVAFRRRLCNSRAKDKIKNEIDSGGAT
jgi:hypothetical protein